MAPAVNSGWIGTRRHVRSLVVCVGVAFACISYAGTSTELRPTPKTSVDAATYRIAAVGDNIVAIAAIDSMSTVVWSDGFGAGAPHVRLHLDVVAVLHGQLSSETVVVSGQAAICSGGNLVVAEIGDAGYWPYVGDVALFSASRARHDGADIWHVTQMHLVGGAAKPATRLYVTELRRGQRLHVNCSGCDGAARNNCVPRTLTDGGSLDDVLREFATEW